MSDPLLAVEDLTTVFHTDKETIRAVDGVSFDLDPGETVGIVGESGSGKSVTARSVMGLIDSPGEVAPESSIRFDGEELTTKTESEWEQVRGRKVAMVFQDPLTALNPVYTVGNQIKEALLIHRGMRGAEATDEAERLLQDVGIPDARSRLREYPHQFSGGMRQRAVIAMTLACDPEVLICDEPTTALDVTTQAQILDLLADLGRDHDLGIVFITHDMGVIAEVADRVNVMYAGEIVESAPVGDLFTDPSHPYTQGLLESIPGNTPEGERLRTIEGEVPTPNAPPADCRFAPRCPEAFEACQRVHPESVPVAGEDGTHTAACLLYPGDRDREDALALHAGGGDAAGGGDDPGHDVATGGGADDE